MRGRLSFIVVIMFLPVALSACGRGGMTYSPVSGKVTLDGKPLANANVVFIPIAKPGSDISGDTAGGVTDENGQYTLKTSTRDGLKDGAQVGKHRVSISKQFTRGEGDRSITNETLPRRYNEVTELTADVAAGTNQKDFELKSR